MLENILVGETKFKGGAENDVLLKMDIVFKI